MTITINTSSSLTCTLSARGNVAVASSGSSVVSANGSRIGTVDIGGTISCSSAAWIVYYHILEISSLITTIVEHESNI